MEQIIHKPGCPSPHMCNCYPTVSTVTPPVKKLTRAELVNKYYSLSHARSTVVNPQACGIRKERLTWPGVVSLDQEMAQVCDQLAQPDNRVQPKDDWERHHGIWLLIAMPDHGYLPGELLKIRTSAQVWDGERLRDAVLCIKINNTGRDVVLLIDSSKVGGFVGAEMVMPAPLLM